MENILLKNKIKIILFKRLYAIPKTLTGKTEKNAFKTRRL